jgi:hypothetical protein
MPCDYGLDPAGFEPKHIDRKALYVSLEERIKYLHDFLDFNSGKQFTYLDYTIPYGQKLISVA